MENLEREEDYKVLGKFKKILVKDIEFCEKNISMLVLIPAFLGGLWQIIELSLISPSYIRFFSINQIVPDGLSILFIMFYSYCIFNISDIFFGNRMYSKENSRNDSKPLLILTFFIFSFSAFIFFKKNYTTEYSTYFSAFNGVFLCIGFIMSLFVALNTLEVLIEKSNLRNKLKFIYNIYFRFFGFLVILIFLFIALDSPLQSFRKLLLIPNNLHNLDLPTKDVIIKYKLCSNPKLIHFNRDYLFYEIEVNYEKKIHILETKALFSDTEYSDEE